MEVLTALMYTAIAYVIYHVIDWLIRLPSIGKRIDRYILVTGCDTGFGNDCVKKLDRLGCQVFAGCLTEAGETSLRKSCSDRVRTVHLDVSSPESVRKAFTFVSKEIPKGSGLWGLVNNAGIAGRVGAPEWLTLDDYKKVFDINLYGIIDMCEVFLPLIKPVRGRIVNTASVLGRFAMPNCPPYTISKFGVEAYSDILRRSMRPFGVTVHIIEPGFHRTNITNTDAILKTYQASFESAKPEVQKEYGEGYLGAAAEFLHWSYSLIMTEGTDDVSSTYVRALLSLFPRARYPVGTDARLIFLPVTRLPEWLSDYLFDLKAPVPAICLK